MADNFYVLANDGLIAVVNGKRRAFAFEQELGQTVAAFAAWLGSLPVSARKRPSYLICDLTETDLRIDTVPHLSGSDRAQVLERKLAQTFRATPYRYATIVGRLADGRRDDQVLLCALTNPDLISPWVDALLRVEAKLVAIVAAPLLIAKSAATTPAKANELKQNVVVTACAGVSAATNMWRQTYLRGDKPAQLCFSRTFRLAEDQSFLPAVTAEVSRTLQYLDSLR
jgi:hypothetical protein